MTVIIKLKILTDSYKNSTQVDLIKDWLREEVHNANYMTYNEGGTPSGNINIRVIDWKVEDAKMPEV